MIFNDVSMDSCRRKKEKNTIISKHSIRSNFNSIKRREASLQTQRKAHIDFQVDVYVGLCVFVLSLQRQ